MQKANTSALSEVLDHLEATANGETISVEDIVETLGHKSFASMLLVFSLISTSPASAIPGVTTMVAGIDFALVAQMIIGRETVWLPDVITGRQLPAAKLCKGISWLRKPVAFVEGLLSARLTFLCHEPWLWLPLSLILVLTTFMPFMEIIPTSGSIASAVISLFAAGLLTRDGGIIAISVALLLAIPLVIGYIGFMA